MEQVKSQKVYDIKKRTYNLALEIIQLVRLFKNEASSRVIANQLLRATTSVGANVVEAQASSSRKDFIQFYTIALKSANEAEFWLRLTNDSKIYYGDRMNLLINEVREIAKILAACVISAKNKKF